MAGICSAHYWHEKDCPRCNALPKDALNVTQKEWDEAVRRAVTAGVHQCRKCKFVYYKTTELCPKCSHRRGNTITTLVGSWWTAVKNWLGITAR